MKNVASSINGVAGAVVGVVKGLIVAFVFATILFGPIDALNNGVNPIEGITGLVDMFLEGGLAGLLALMVFASFMD